MVLPFAGVGKHGTDVRRGFGQIRVDDTLDLSVRLEARRDDVSVGDGLQQEPKEGRVLYEKAKQVGIRGDRVDGGGMVSSMRRSSTSGARRRRFFSSRWNQ